MKAVQIAKDIVPIAEFKAQSASWLERVRASGSTRCDYPKWETRGREKPPSRLARSTQPMKSGSISKVVEGSERIRNESGLD